MINLLPDETKREIKAARTNVILLRYNFFTLAALGLLGLFCAAFYLVLGNAQSSAASVTAKNQAKAQSYAKVRIAADEYRTNLTIANQILNNSINYSSFVFKLSQLLPKGVVLDNLSLSPSIVTTQTSFTARTTSYDKATELKETFQKSPLFTNVYFQTLTDNGASGNGQSTKYPITVTISVKINKVALE